MPSNMVLSALLALSLSSCSAFRTGRRPSSSNVDAAVTDLPQIFGVSEVTSRSRAYRDDCDQGPRCRDVSFGKYTYQCRFAGGDDCKNNPDFRKGLFFKRCGDFAGTQCSKEVADNCPVACNVGCGAGEMKGNIVMLHGFPMWSEHYNGLLRGVAAKGYRGVACNQRGYSPGASPSDVSEYNYNYLRDDVFALADAVGYESFHLVGHDHGAVLGWYTAGSSRGRERIISYTAMSIPHITPFSKALYGPEADLDQQMASQYFTMFVQPNSASLHGSFLYKSMGFLTGFSNVSSFQGALNWYNGVYEIGLFSMPPTMSALDIVGKGGSAVIASMRTVFGNDGDQGFAATQEAGDATMPVLYICGKDDASILCARPWALKTEDHCKGGYTYFEANCGHSPLSCKENTQPVIDKIVAHIIAHS